ncbi:MAG: hypothetical protein JNL08_12185 [Planctomycetes bacterium]|nr:hypothetical protein [Planctomycetota bacterium]
MKIFAPILAAACVASLASDALAGGREPGSLLVYPVHRSGGAPGTPSNGVAPGFFTVVSVTNTNLNPATILSLGGSTNVHFYYVNVSRNQYNQFEPYGCSIFNRVEPLTPADTLSVLTGCHNATFGGQEGYLVVAAENPALFQTSWSHNHLLGSELVLAASGLSFSVEAVALKSPVAAGQPTDVNSNGAYDFDGVEYEALPDLLYIDSFIAIQDSALTLINFTGTDADKNRVLLSVWNDYEFPLSATVEFKCWFEARLSQVSTLFTEQFLRSTPNDPNELDISCDGYHDLETGWVSIESLGVRNPGGQLIAADGAMLGAITTGVGSLINGGRLLAESVVKQTNGSFAH